VSLLDFELVQHFPLKYLRTQIQLPWQFPQNSDPITLANFSSLPWQSPGQKIDGIGAIPRESIMARYRGRIGAHKSVKKGGVGGKLQR
jgi:hypothetical protein